MTAPATAVAISQRKNSWPMLSRSASVDAHDRMPGLLERREPRVLARSSLRRRAADRRTADRRHRRFGGAERLAIDRDDAFARACRSISASSCSSQAPKSARPGESNEASACRGRPSAAAPSTMPSATPGLSAGGTSAPHERHHHCRALEQPRHIEAHRRGRHHAEVGEHRIAPADAGIAVEDRAGSLSRLARLLQRRARIGDGDEMPPALSAPTAASTRAKKYASRMLGSSVVPDLLETMNSVRAGSISASTRAICSGSVELSTSSFGMPGLPAERLGQHFGPEARAAHAEQDRVGEAVASATSPRNASRAATSTRSPRAMSSQPSQLASSAPVHSAASRRPEPARPCLRARHASRGRDSALRRSRRARCLLRVLRRSPSSVDALAGDRAESLSAASANSWTPSSTSRSVTSSRSRSPARPSAVEHASARPRRPASERSRPCRGRGRRPWSRAAWC